MTVLSTILHCVCKFHVDDYLRHLAYRIKARRDIKSRGGQNFLAHSITRLINIIQNCVLHPYEMSKVNTCHIFHLKGKWKYQLVTQNIVYNTGITALLMLKC